MSRSAPPFWAISALILGLLAAANAAAFAAASRSSLRIPTLRTARAWSACSDNDGDDSSDDSGSQDSAAGEAEA
jgi:hypothetical protein